MRRNREAVEVGERPQTVRVPTTTVRVTFYKTPWLGFPMMTLRKGESMTNPIPEGYHSVTPYLIIKDAAAAIEFYKKALNAKEVVRMPMPDGRIGHAELLIGDSHIMLADEMPDMGHRSPSTLGGTTFSLMLYVQNVDAQFEQAVSPRAT